MQLLNTNLSIDAGFNEQLCLPPTGISAVCFLVALNLFLHATTFHSNILCKTAKTDSAVLYFKWIPVSEVLSCYKHGPAGRARRVTSPLLCWNSTSQRSTLQTCQPDWSWQKSINDNDNPHPYILLCTFGISAEVKLRFCSEAHYDKHC